MTLRLRGRVLRYGFLGYGLFGHFHLNWSLRFAPTVLVLRLQRVALLLSSCSLGPMPCTTRSPRLPLEKSSDERVRAPRQAGIRREPSHGPAKIPATRIYGRPQIAGCHAPPMQTQIE